MTDAELLVSSRALDNSRVDTAKVYQQSRGGTLAGAVLSLNLATDKVVRMLREEITGIRTVDPSLMTVYPDFLERVNTPVPAHVCRLHHHGRVTIREPHGCPACGGAGYRGRTGIFDVLRMSAAIEDLVMRRASVSEIRSQAYRDGVRTLRAAALSKVVAGETSLAEVLEHTVAVDMPVAVPA